MSFSVIFSDFYAYICTNISGLSALYESSNTRPKHIALIRHLRGICKSFIPHSFSCIVLPLGRPHDRFRLSPTHNQHPQRFFLPVHWPFVFWESCKVFHHSVATGFLKHSGIRGNSNHLAVSNIQRTQWFQTSSGIPAPLPSLHVLQPTAGC